MGRNTPDLSGTKVFIRPEGAIAAWEMALFQFDDLLLLQVRGHTLLRPQSLWLHVCSSKNPSSVCWGVGWLFNPPVFSLGFFHSSCSCRGVSDFYLGTWKIFNSEFKIPNAKSLCWGCSRQKGHWVAFSIEFTELLVKENRNPKPTFYLIFIFSRSEAGLIVVIPPREVVEESYQTSKF